MRDRFVHHLSDPTGIGEWLAQKTGAGAGRPVLHSPPAPVAVHREPDIAPEPPQTVLTAEEEWANLSPTHLWARASEPNLKPKTPEPKKAAHCVECNGPMPLLVSAAKKFCSRQCKSVWDHRQERMVPVDPDAHRMVPVPK